MVESACKLISSSQLLFIKINKEIDSNNFNSQKKGDGQKAIPDAKV